MKVKAIIGANFGDEGKGKIANAYSKGWADILVRHNGGCQAAHTVLDKQNFRHVFGHIGSASAHKVPTFLSKYFVVNPTLFLRERDEVLFKNRIVNLSDIYVDSRCPVTTVYDVILNQTIENKRKDARHGSCGVGFHETLVREEKGYHLTVENIANMGMPQLFNYLRYVRDMYYIPKIAEIGTDYVLPYYIKSVLYSDETVVRMIDHFNKFLDIIHIRKNADFLKNFNNILFEGAQGLLLDENHKWFPHVTHSSTGCKNIVETLKEIEMYENVVKNDNFEVTYVSRCYATRHGAGPFPTEQAEMKDFNVVDPTNIPNDYQGALRIGYLDAPLMNRTIMQDAISSFKSDNVKIKLHFTCMDQIIFPYKYSSYTNEIRETPFAEQTLQGIFRNLTDKVEFSYSPYMEDVQEYQ